MKVALIPPIPDLRRTPKTGIHLLLSHLFKDPEYVSFYQERRHAGDLLILDNGAHEKGIGEKESSLLDKALQVGAQEIVLPDVLFDRTGTVERTRRMLSYIVTRGWEKYVEAGMPRLMMVPQSQDKYEWQACLKALLNTWELHAGRAPVPFESPVIGISKDYDNWRGGLHRLIRDYVEPVFDQRDFDVHLLGWANNLWSTAEIARDFPWVRSTDSAKPFVYAKNRIRLEPGGKIPRYPRRDSQYFNCSLARPGQWEIALTNIAVYRAAAENELI